MHKHIASAWCTASLGKGACDGCRKDLIHALADCSELPELGIRADCSSATTDPTKLSTLSGGQQSDKTLKNPKVNAARKKHMVRQPNKLCVQHPYTLASHKIAYQVLCV